MFTASVITVSDSGFKGIREDLSGPAIAGILSANGYTIIDAAIVPDETDAIAAIFKKHILLNANLIVTTGGTGFSPRDVTPEATKTVIEREAPGIAEAIRQNSMRYTERAMLSRGIAGIAKNSLIINLPGSPKAVKESLEYILPSVAHGLDILLEKADNCARKD